MSLSILGTGSALPNLVKTNADLTTFLDTSDEWIRTRTGIGQRHILQDESLTDITALAAQRALENSKTKIEEIDYIICPSFTGDYLTPSLSCLLQQRLGATCPAVDVNAACTGFMYGMDLASGLLAAGRAKRILMVAAEALSRITNWEDRSTAVLFGDGAGAVVLAPGDDLLYLHLTSQGDDRFLYAPFVSGNFPEGPKESRAPYISMNGGEVYKFAVNAIFTGLQKALDETGLKTEDVKHVLLHQANLRIIEAAQKKLGIPSERYAINIQNVGNLSAASIPVLMDEYNRKGAFADGDLMVLSAFGGGFTTGTAILRWNKK